MAFLPDLTAAASTRTVEKGVERRNRDKRSGYRVSLANCKSTRGQEDCDNVVSRCQRSGQANKSQRLPPIETARNFEAKSSSSEDERHKSKQLKLPKCSSPLTNRKSMFWIEPLGLWVPLQQGRRLYEKFSSRIDLLYKDPDYLMDPWPHIPRCDHSRGTWSAVKLERQRFRELRELRNEQLLQKTVEKYQTMQELWLQQLNNRSELLQGTPSHVRLQNFRKTTGFLAPLDQSRRLERLQERQREWEEAWRLACERREKAAERKKSPRNMLPRIVVTEYEFVSTCDEHVNANYQSCDIYTEESYNVVCRPVECLSDENMKTRPVLKQRFQNGEPTAGTCDTKKVAADFNRSEKEPESFESSVNESRSFDPHGSLETEKDFEDNTRLDHTDKIRGEYIPENRADSPKGGNSGITECEENASKSDVTQGSLLATTLNSSRSSLDSGIPDMRMADETVGLMNQLVPVPLGVSTGKILDGQMTSSSAMDVYHVANQARLHNEKQDRNGGAWLPRQHDVNPYLQVDLGHVTTVQQVATQGNPASAARNERNKRWVSKFSLEFSHDGINWTECQESGELKIFTGNFDLDSVVLNSLENPVETRYIRFRPKEWHNGIAMRVEVFGSSPHSVTTSNLHLTKEPDAIEEATSVPTEDELDVPLTTEKSSDEVTDKNVETQMDFKEVDANTENIQFGLFVEGHTETPVIAQSPVPCLVSPHEQNIEIRQYMESEICTQDLQLKELTDTSDVESSASTGAYDVSEESSSINVDTPLEEDNSKKLISTEETHNSGELILAEESQESDPQSDGQESDTGSIQESARLPSPVQLEESAKDVPPSPVPSPAPSSPALESWAHALERAQADGSIQRQLMREKMAEQRRKKLAMLDSKKRRLTADQMVITQNLDELGHFLEKYCIIKKSDLSIYKNIFEKFDGDEDGFLWPGEALEALERVNSRLLSDGQLRYVFRVLEQCDCQADFGIGFRLFSVIAALSQRVASLNDKMKKLISQYDLKTLDYTIERVKMLFQCYVNEDTMRISRTDLWIGLAAGGLRSAEATIDDYFSGKHSFDFLDFLTHLPLFQEIHGHVVENPLTLF